MARNKVVFGNQVLIDLTDSTVTPETLAFGHVAYNAAGERIVGTMIPFSEVQSEGYWKYRIYEDDTFEAWYLRASFTFNISYASGNFYRSDPYTFVLPTAVSSGNVENVQAQVFHANFPVFGAVSALNPIKVQALSGANRGSQLCTAVIYAFGTL